MKNFQNQMETYLELAREKAVLEQIVEFLEQFLPSDTQQEVKTIKNRHGAMIIEVDHGTIEKFVCEAQEKIAQIVKEVEAL